MTDVAPGLSAGYDRSPLVRLAPNIADVVGSAGIPFASTSQVHALEDQLGPGLGSAFRDIRNRFWVATGEGFLMRGSGFYLACPPYVFPAKERVAVRADEALGTIGDFLLDAAQANLELDGAGRQIIGSILDGFKNVATHVSDVVFRREVIEDRTIVAEPVETWLDDLYAAYWTFLAGDALALPASDWRAVLRELDSTEPFEVTMRELDDQRAILDSCASILDYSARDETQFTAVCDFVSGGIELGPSLRAICGILGLDLPQVFHVVYSSKGNARDPRVGRLPEDRSDFVRQVPPRSREPLSRILDEPGAILLFDNNVTTFKTLEAGKRSLQRPDVYAAAVQIHRGNLEATLSGDEQAEGLVDRWGDVLDFPPIAEYVTAFSTWGSSEKTRELHQRFGTVPVQVEPDFATSAPSIPLKACRVHNLVDLALLYREGVRTFGIHAVASDREAYDRAQRDRGARLEAIHDSLPISSGEVESIRAMTAGAPPDCVFVVVVEQTLAPSDLTEIVRLYGLALGQTVLQLQCSVTERDLALYRSLGFSGIIVAVGADDPHVGDVCRALGTLSSTDKVLLDFSSHQPHLIEHGAQHSGVVPDVEMIAAHLVSLDAEVLLAYEGTPEMAVELRNRIAALGVRVCGIDTQNSLEYPKQGWRYRVINDYSQLVRKSPENVAKWSRALRGMAGEFS